MDKLKAREHLNNGVKAYSAKRFDEAIEEFQKAIELDPELIDGLLYLATTYRAEFVPFVPTPENLRKGQEAIATFEKVIELDPNNYNAMANIADTYRNMSDPDNAKVWYRKIGQFEEHKAEALYGIGVIDYNLAEEKTGIDGENIVNLTEEELAEVNQLVEEAIESLKQSLEVKPNYTDAMEYLNLLYREKAEMAVDEEEKTNWLKEADRLALEALRLKREQQRAEEEARRKIFAGEGEEEQ
jgi:tetratricopeptide (TPR) repeat protein